MRIAIIWILAILSPLAFACWILPQTEKHWKEWLQELTEWLTFGVLIILLAGLGLKLFALNTVVPGTGPISIGGMGLFPAFTYNYVFLLVYLGVVFYYSKKYTPQLATVLIGYATTLGKGTQRLATTATMQRQLWGPAAEKAAKGFAGTAKRLEPLSKLSYQFRGRTVKPLSWTTRAAQVPVAPLIEYAAKVRKIPLPGGWKQMTIDDKVDMINAKTRDESKLVLMHAMGEEGTLQKAPQLHKLAERLEEKFKKDPHYLKERNDVADILTNKVITADVKINLEVTKEDQDKMRKDIETKAGELSQEIEMRPVIDEEAKRLLKEGLVKTQAEAQDLAAKNVAAKYIHYTELKSGDIKNAYKGSIESDIAARAFRDMTPQHIQAVQNNFKTETINKVMDKTFRRMFQTRAKDPATGQDIKDPVTGEYKYEDLPEEESRKILDKYYESDPKHARMVHWAATTPAGRELNLPSRRYMSDPNGLPTTSFAAFERRMRIQEALKKEPALAKFYELSTRITRIEKKVKEEREKPVEKRVPEEEIRKLEGELKKAKEEAEEEEARINRHPEEKAKWEEIEILKKAPREKPPRRK